MCHVNRLEPVLGRHFDQKPKFLVKIRNYSKMSNKTESEWDADYQQTVPHFDDSFGIHKGAITPDMVDSKYDPVQVQKSMKFVTFFRHMLTFSYNLLIIILCRRVT